MEQYEIAHKSQPGNGELIASIGHAQRGLGRFDEALANIKEACELDPLHFTLHYQLGFTLTMMREYAEAENSYERANTLAPDQPMPYIWRARNQVLWQGKDGTAKAREVLEQALGRIGTRDRFSIVNWLVTIDVYDRRYKEALERLSSVPDDYERLIGHIPNELRRALIYRYMNQEELAKEHFELARSKLDVEIERKPEDARLRGPLGIAYAGLGRKEDAIDEGELALELDPEDKTGFHSAWIRELAFIYVMVDEDDGAIDKIEYLLRNLPARLSIPLLQLDPAWDPLRNHSRFQELVESGK